MVNVSFKQTSVGDSIIKNGKLGIEINWLSINPNEINEKIKHEISLENILRIESKMLTKLNKNKVIFYTGVIEFIDILYSLINIFSFHKMKYIDLLRM